MKYFYGFIQNRYIKWITVGLCMLMIFAMSHLDAVRSWHMTGRTLVVLSNSHETVEGMDYDEEIQYYSDEEQNGDMLLLRKSAHVIEYFLLSGLLVNALWSRIAGASIDSFYYGRRGVAMAFLISLLYALFDEAHQLLVPGRTGDIIDVMIDALGGVLGAFTAVFMLRIIGKASHIDQIVD